MIVTQADPRWRQPGIGSEDAQVVLGMTTYQTRDRLKEKVLMRLLNLDQSGPDWHTWRDAGIGGSDSASVLGMNPWKSRSELLEEKVSKSETHGENENTRRGKLLEPDARARYEALYGTPMPPACVVHDQHPFIRASLDGLRADHQLILEIKCPTARNHLGNLEGDLPGYYFCQVQHQLLIVGCPMAHFVSYCPAHKPKPFHVVPVKADTDFQEILLRELVKFWDEVQSELEKFTPPGA